MTALNPDQFLFHGTAMNVEGDKLLPASVHGKGSYWGATGGDARGEAAQDHAWAHPDENKAWQFAHDRVIHTSNTEDWNPRARVYAVHQNEQQSPGHDASIPGEVKAPHFDVAKRIDIMPGRQGTFPEINWNHHVVHTGLFTDDEDANHPTNLSIQFGHREGRWGGHGNGDMRKQAHEENMNRYLDRVDALNLNRFKPELSKDTMLPGMPRSNDPRDWR